jgi:hypothetical protein
MTTETLNAPRSFLAVIGDKLAGAYMAIAETSSAARCAQEAERLFALSDEELARRGLTRDRVIQHAFRRYFA